MTFVPKFNIYATKDGVATHKAEDNTLVIAAGSPVSTEEATRLKLPELEAVAAEKAKAATPKTALKPAEISATDAKVLEKAEAADAAKVPAKTKVPDVAQEGK